MIEVAVHNAHGDRRVESGRIRSLVHRVVKREGYSNARVSVVFTDDRLSRRINRKFFGHDRPTDVMSFPLEDDGTIEGELYVNLDKAARQAGTYHVSRLNEIARLVIHGVLHLLGYDDTTRRAARRMKETEDYYVGLLAGKELVQR
ncbi:MAG: rRNA maturation RNase YbeY [Bacteroidota bacterium]